MSTRTVHIAGPVQDGVQRCSRCGTVLIDDVRIGRFRVGESVYVGAFGSGWSAHEPNCEVRDNE